MKIRKVIIGVTLLMHEADEDRLSTMSLARIGEEIDFGDMVGAFAITSSSALSHGAVARELLALGNDGTFFGELESEDEASDTMLAAHPAAPSPTQASTIGALICELLETRMTDVGTGDCRPPDVTSDVHRSGADIVALSSRSQDEITQIDLTLDDATAFRLRIEPLHGTSMDLPAEIGARVRIRPRPRVGKDRYANREGIIVRPHFAGFYVRLDMTPRERSQKTELVETGYLEVLASPARPDVSHPGED